MRPKLPFDRPYSMNVLVDPEVYRKVRHIAVDRGLTVGEAVRQALAAFVASAAAPQGKGSRAPKL
jgi:hypothetical protein